MLPRSERGTRPDDRERRGTRDDRNCLGTLARSAAGGLLAGGDPSLRGGGGGKKDFLHFGELDRRLLEAAASPVTDEDVSAFSFAQEHIRIAAFRARLRDRAGGEREVAGRIVDAAVEGAEPAAPLGDDSAVFGTAHARVLDRFGRLVLAGGVTAARDVDAEAAMPAHERVPRLGTDLPRRLVGSGLGLSAGHHDV